MLVSWEQSKVTFSGRGHVEAAYSHRYMKDFRRYEETRTMQMGDREDY